MWKKLGAILLLKVNGRWAPNSLVGFSKASYLKQKQTKKTPTSLPLSMFLWFSSCCIIWSMYKQQFN